MNWIELCKNGTDTTVEEALPEVARNTLLCLIHSCPGRPLRQLEQRFRKLLSSTG